MHCPFCRSTDTRVLDSRVAEDGTSIRRRRTCPECEKRFTTVEQMQLTVLKRNGTSEPFQRDKAVAGVQRGLRLVLDRRVIEKNPAVLAQLKARLKAGGKGEIRFVLPLADRGKEIEFGVPGRYDVSPGVAGVLSTIPGVSEVLEI